MDTKINRVLSGWQSDPDIVRNIIAWQTQPSCEASWQNFPAGLDNSLVSSLNQLNIHQLYSHQLEAWNAIQNGNHIVVVTGTSSGKTLCYNLPVLDYLRHHPDGRAIRLCSRLDRFFFFQYNHLFHRMPPADWLGNCHPPCNDQYFDPDGHSRPFPW